MLLEVRDLEVRYGGIRAVKGVSLEVGEGELVCLIGANGAGKTSTLKAICRLLPSQAQAVRYAGEDIARALMSEPRLLLLDEPSMGLAPMMVAKIFEIVRDIARRGVTILLVEQNALLALQAASRGYVMESGAITLSGPAQALLADPRVKEAYLGEGAS